MLTYGSSSHASTNDPTEYSITSGRSSSHRINIRLCSSVADPRPKVVDLAFDFLLASSAKGKPMGLDGLCQEGVQEGFDQLIQLPFV